MQTPHPPHPRPDRLPNEDSEHDELWIELDSGESFSIELLSVQTPAQSMHITREIDQVLDRTPAGSDWVVDVSGLSFLPVSLVGVLTRTHRDFSMDGRAVRLRGVRPDMLPHATMRLLESILPPDVAPSLPRT